VDVRSVDDDSTASTAATQVAAALSSATKPEVVFDGLTDPEGFAMVPALNSAHILAENTTYDPVLDSPSKYPYQFSSNPSFISEGSDPATEAAKHGVHRLALIYASEAADEAEAAATRSAAKALGIATAAHVGYNPTTLNMTPEWLAVAAAHPDGIVLITAGQSAIALKGRAAAGVTTFTLCETSCSAQPLRTLDSPAAVKNVYMEALPIATTPPNQRTTIQAEFVKQLMALGYSPGDLTGPALEGDFLLAVNAAAKLANSVDPQVLQHQLENFPEPQYFAMGTPMQWSATLHAAVPSGLQEKAFRFVAAGDNYVGGVFEP
jgi:ABC-type branched-subunit amino acid transport system substrate-binding protein